MKILLPSQGKTGIVSVEMRQPKISDLRRGADFTDISGIRKNEFLRLLLTDSSVLSKITVFDRDYLFLVAIAVVSLNTVKFKWTCQCGKQSSDQIRLDDCEPVFLKKKQSLELKIDIRGKEFKFRILTPNEEERALEFALLEEDSFKDRLEDAKLCLSLGKDLTEKEVDSVREEDIMIYYVYDAFQKAMFHGTLLSKVCTCSCGLKKDIFVPIEGSMLNADTSILMSRFVSVSKRIDFLSFLELTIPEYNAMITELENG